MLPYHLSSYLHLTAQLPLPRVNIVVLLVRSMFDIHPRSVTVIFAYSIGRVKAKKC